MPKSRKRSKPKNRPITEEEAQRAIYLDFEGRGAPHGQPAPPPVLGGTLIEGEYTDTIVSEELAQVAIGRSRDFVPLEEYLEDLLRRARVESRRIVYWTSHEAELFEQHGFPPGGLGFDLKIDVRPHMEDLFKEAREAKKALRTAKTKTAREKARRKASGLCVECAARHGFKTPTNYGRGTVGITVKRALDQASRRPDYASWPSGAKRAWSRLVTHNKADCEAMKLLMPLYGVRP